LTEVQESPTGEGCTTRLYSYEEASNRTSLTTRKPGTEGKCATEGGTVEAHNYDEAGRLTDSGITYDPLGNVTKLPAGDSEGHTLESTFYVDGAVATQTQNGVTNDYYLDPSGRVRETVNGAKKAIAHYDSFGEAIAWTSEGSGETEKWKRNIPGIDGTLTAVEEGEGKTGETPVLELHDLQGDVVATVEGLGAGDVERSLPSGVITEGATSYVPQTGRALQAEEVEPPGAPEGTGVGAQYTAQLEPWVMQGATREADEAPGIGAAEERAAAEAACKVTVMACGGVDPSFSVMLGGGGAELIENLINSGATGVLAHFVVKWAKLGGLEAQVVAELLVAAGDEVANGLNYCVETFKAIGRPGGQAFRCLVTFNHIVIPGPPFIFPEKMEFSDCYWLDKKKGYNCEGVYTIGWPLGLS
jgi:hypothetical protein